MKTRTRAVRVDEDFEKAIKEFLAKNKFLNFSMLARLAIEKFIKEKNNIRIK